MGFISVSKEKVKFFVGRFFKNSKLNIKDDTFLYSRLLDNKLIKCEWNLSENDKKRLFSIDSYLLSIRLYDITKVDYEEKTTCIMKEIELKKNTKECFLTPLVRHGNLLIELGFRKPYGEWFLLATSELMLGARTYSDYFYDDSWFYSSREKKINDNSSIHEDVYQLSFSGLSGGSEKIHERS